MSAEHIRALGPLYAAMLFEQLKAYEVADRLVELFQQGLLPIDRAGAAHGLLTEWTGARRSPSAEERSRAFAEVQPNREFHELWLRFITAVTTLGRQPAGKELAARDTARELAAHLPPHHGADAALVEQVRLQLDVLRRLLAHPEIAAACATEDLAPLLERVPAFERGVRAALQPLLSASDAFTALPPSAQETIARDTSLVADLLAAVDFPDFVASLIAGTFDALVNVSIQQMEAYAKLVSAVAASLDAFRAGTVTENEMRDQLVDQFPEWLGPEPDRSAYDPGLAAVLITGIQRITSTITLASVC